MFINKKQKGYGWYAQVKNTDNNGIESKAYINFNFKRGHEPIELNEFNAYEGELIFRTRYGSERRVYPIAKSYNGQSYVEFMLLEDKLPMQKGYEVNSPEFDEEVKVDMDELPFY